MTSAMRGGWVVCLTLLAVCVVGCAPPSAVRRTTLIPGPGLPARVGAPLDEGHGRAAVEIDALELFDVGSGELVDADMGDPGVLVPNLQLGAMLYYALSSSFELGGQLSYTRASWAEQNVAGVLPFPDGTSDELWSGGMGARLHLFRDEEQPNGGGSYSIGLLTELDLANVPEVVFVRDTSASGVDGYRLHDHSKDLFLLPNVAVIGTVRADEHFHLDALVGLRTSVRNVGFDEEQNVDDETAESFWLGYAGVGVDFSYDAFFANLHLYVPIDGQEKIDFGILRAQLQTGVGF